MSVEVMLCFMRANRVHTKKNYFNFSIQSSQVIHTYDLYSLLCIFIGLKNKFKHKEIIMIIIIKKKEKIKNKLLLKRRRIIIII